MSCKSCSGTIESTLQNLSGIIKPSIRVNFLTGNASLEFDNDSLTIDQIKDSITSIGFGIEVDEKSKNATNTTNSINNDHATEDSTNITTKFLISGMSCASCIGTIEATLLQLPGVAQVNINLLTTEASIKHDQSKIGVRDLMRNISDIGFEPQLLKANSSDLQFGNRIRQKTEKEQKLLRNRFLISLLFAIPTFLIVMVFEMIKPNPINDLLTYQIVTGLDVETLILFLLATPVQFILGYPFYLKGFKSLYYTRQANMDTLVALGTTVSYLGSMINVLIPIFRHSSEAGYQFFETSIFLITFIWLGRWMELKAKGKTFETITKLMELQPEKAILVEITYDKENNMVTDEKEIDLELVQVGDILKVNPGARIPCDGKIYNGITTLDESMITGESIPITRTIDEPVITATVNLTSMIWMKAERVGSDTTLSRIIKLVQEAQSSKKAPIEELADKIAQVFVPTVISIAILDFLIWVALTNSGIVPSDWITDNLNNAVFSLFFAISVLVIACPCAMGLASPTAIMVGTGVAAKHGILIKGGGEAIETAYRLNTIAFDKTGTLTYGKPKVVAIKFSYRNSNKEKKYKSSALMEIIRLIESASDHPLARAAVQHIDKSFIKRRKKTNNFVELDSIIEVPGRGLEAIVSIRSNNPLINELLLLESTNDAKYNNNNKNGKKTMKYSAKYKVFIGNEKWMHENNCIYPAASMSFILNKWKKSGYSVVLTGLSRIGSSKTTTYNGYIMANIGIADTPRPDSKKTIEKLKSLGIEVWMITGDNPITAKAIGKQLGIDNIFSEVTPEMKADKIKWLQRKGTTILTATQANHNSSAFFYFNKFLSCFNFKHHVNNSTTVKSTTIIKQAIVAMIGDGINDSPALAQSNLPITIASATDVAIESSSVILTRSTLSSLITLLSLSKTIIWRIRLNFLWAYIYNSLAIPIAAGAFFPLIKHGLRPEYASLAMVASSTTVVVSSLMLKNYKEPNYY
ncbi:17908_t:CDS:2 [Entrophospora sp. SA101]|nr:7679_t:CDS:2 [Entrophospora sp. SA101]CAJ0746355.1 17908_t:CDS:2 [Entrophospora sp. SA101]CAJ0842189.1 19397_t:CDS:2 [Entrophospora sp. SA101]CAJ0844345.1 14633_t:CDS:2 [Entrophospora sp. SA101]